MPVVLLLAAVAVVAATVALALGRGGRLQDAPVDHPASGLPDHRLARGTDVAMLNLPKGPWGYSVPVTDEVIGRLAHALTVQEGRAASLERELAEARSALSGGHAAPFAQDAPVPYAAPASFGGSGSTAHDPWPPTPALPEAGAREDKPDDAYQEEPGRAWGRSEPWERP